MQLVYKSPSAADAAAGDVNQRDREVAKTLRSAGMQPPRPERNNNEVVLLEVTWEVIRGEEIRKEESNKQSVERGQVH